MSIVIGEDALEAARAGDNYDGFGKVINQQALIERNDQGVSEAPRRRGIAERLSSAFRKRDLAVSVPEARVAREDAWERGRSRR